MTKMKRQRHKSDWQNSSSTVQIKLKGTRTRSLCEYWHPPECHLGSIRRVRFIQSTLRQASIRENKGPSLGKIHVKIPQQRSPYAAKFEDGSQEKTERQERCARGKAWNLAKIFTSSKERTKLHSVRLPISGFCGTHPP